MTKTNKTYLVDSGLITQFSKEIQNYAKALDRFLDGDGMFGSQPKMPSTNTNEIKDKYIRLSTEDLQSRGLGRVRAKGLSKSVFTELLDLEMNEVSI